MARLTATATQGGADAFVQAAMQTALTGITRQAYRITEVQFQLTSAGTPMFPNAAANEQAMYFALTRRSKAAIPLISDVDVIKSFVFTSAYWTGAGYGPMNENIRSWIPQTRTLIVEDPVYVQLDSDATGVAWSLIVNVEYEVVTITELDRLTLLTASLV